MKFSFRNRTHTHISIKKESRGFTLIEILVAVAIFVPLILLVIASFLQLNSTHRSLQNKNAIMQQLQYGVQLMSTEIRAGSAFESGCEGGCEDLVFATQVRSDMPRIRIEYHLSSTTHQLVRAAQTKHGVCSHILGSGFGAEFPPECYSPLTSKDVTLDHVEFFVNKGTTTQPTITIVMDGSIGEGADTEPFHLAPTFTPRLITLPNAKPPGDNTGPRLTINTPVLCLPNATSCDTYTTDDTSVVITGTAEDGSGVSQVNWDNGSGASIVPVDPDDGSWTTISIDVYPQACTDIYITAIDASFAENKSSKKVTVCSDAPRPAYVATNTINGCYPQGDWHLTPESNVQLRFYMDRRPLPGNRIKMMRCDPATDPDGMSCIPHNVYNAYHYMAYSFTRYDDFPYGFYKLENDHTYRYAFEMCTAYTSTDCGPMSNIITLTTLSDAEVAVQCPAPPQITITDPAYCDETTTNCSATTTQSSIYIKGIVKDFDGSDPDTVTSVRWKNGAVGNKTHGATILDSVGHWVTDGPVALAAGICQSVGIRARATGGSESWEYIRICSTDSLPSPAIVGTDNACISSGPRNEIDFSKDADPGNIIAIYRCKGASCIPNMRVAYTSYNDYQYDSNNVGDPIIEGQVYRYRIREENEHDAGIHGAWSDIVTVTAATCGDGNNGGDNNDGTGNGGNNGGTNNDGTNDDEGGDGGTNDGGTNDGDTDDGDDDDGTNNPPQNPVLITPTEKVIEISVTGSKYNPSDGYVTLTLSSAGTPGTVTMTASTDIPQAVITFDPKNVNGDGGQTTLKIQIPGNTSQTMHDIFVNVIGGNGATSQTLKIGVAVTLIGHGTD